MKRFKFTTIMMILAIFLFGGISFIQATKADTILPETFVTHSDDRVKLDYIKYKTYSGKDEDYALIAKKAANGTFVYCIDLKKHYDGGITYTKKEAMDVGLVYLLKNRPHTNNSLEDFYITQMAVYMYQDWITGADTNLSNEFKQFIANAAGNPTVQLDAETIRFCKAIFNLYTKSLNYRDAYVAKNGYINITTKNVTFTEKNGYFESSKIYVESGNLKNDIEKTIHNPIDGMKILKDNDDNGYVIRIPVSSIPEGKKATFELEWAGDYDTENVYYYYGDSNHQRLLYDGIEAKNQHVKATISLTVKHFVEQYEVKISKTDVTQQNEIPGAHLEVKDENGKTIESWISTSETHKFVLTEGEYSLTETIAPDGYKKSETTIYFKLDGNGKLYAKVNGQYVPVDKINMINELKDVTSFAKKDATTDKYIAGAILVIKDSNGNVVQEFTSNDSVYQLVLQPGEYRLEEKAAPSGYVLSNEVVLFKVNIDGTLQVKNSNGVYENSVMVVFYNTPEKREVVPVPSTGKSGIILTMSGITLLIAGVVYVIKTTKEC